MEASPAPAPAQPAIAPKQIAALFVLVVVVGLGVSLASWCFLEGTHQLQVGLYDKLPDKLGYSGGAPTWWPLPILAVSGVIVALAIERLPGRGGHEPTGGLGAGMTSPIELPGVVLAAAGTIAFGVVLGPEAPLIALGSGLGVLSVRALRREVPDQLLALIAASGSFAAISFIFGSPIVGAVILIEAAGLDKRQLSTVIPVGLLAAGIGSLISLGMGSWTGLSTADYALETLKLPAFPRPDVGNFGWTILLAVVIALLVFAVVELARTLQPIVTRRRLVSLPLAALAIGGLAILFAQLTDKSSSEVLFSGEDSLPGLAAQAGTWSSGALVAVLLCKSVAWAISLSGFRGGPTFPAIYLGAAAGVLASHGAGLDLTPGVAVGMGCAVVAMLRLPLAAVLIATLLTAHSGQGAGPLVIVGVVITLLISRALDARFRPTASAPQTAEAAPA